MNAVYWLIALIGCLGAAGSIAGSIKREWWFVAISIATAVFANILSFIMCSFS